MAFEELVEAEPIRLHDIMHDTTVVEVLCKAIGLPPGRNGVNLRDLSVLCAAIKDGEAKSMKREKEWWSKLSDAYNPSGVTYNILKVVDQMEANGYLEQRKGYQDRSTGKAFDTRIKATPRLIEFLDGAVAVKHPDTPLLYLKDSEGNPLDYKLTGPVKVKLGQLRRYNALLMDTDIEINGRLLEPRQKHVYRVFNHGTWTKGGRFYGAEWQTCKKELRPTILINGKPTVEPDYSSLHPCLMYAMKGIPMPRDDIYDLPGIPRKYGKVAMLIMINVENRRKATGAYYDEFKGDPDRPKAAEVFDKILEKHPPEIQEMFFTGLGLKLMNLDSELAAYVIDTLTREGIACLSVHDSFVVQERHRDRLTELMCQAYQRQWGCQVSVPDIH